MDKSRVSTIRKKCGRTYQLHCFVKGYTVPLNHLLCQLSLLRCLQIYRLSRIDNNKDRLDNSEILLNGANMPVHVYGFGYHSKIIGAKA